MNIKAAIFDMDGTLVDSLMIWDVLWAHLGVKYLGDAGFTPSREDDKAVRTLPLKQAMTLIHEHYAIGDSGEELLAEANDIIYDFYSHSVKLKDGVREFLAHCQHRGAKMCIASATAPELVEMALEHCGIKEYFTAVFSCSTTGKGKDKPDIFLLAADYLGASQSDIWVFEDSLAAIETAAKIGMNTVGIYDSYNYGQDKIKEIATEYIDSTETLLKLIQ